MTVTFDAEVGRLYKVTYLEPEVQTPSVVNGDTTIAIKLTDASTTALSVSVIKTPSAAKLENQLTTIAIESFASAGSKTFVGVARSSSTTGTPQLERTSSRLAIIIVEDIGPT
jgi:hypothetical protein